MKRAFERKHGILVDQYETPKGRPCTAHIPAWLLDENPSTAERESFLAELGTGSNTESGAIYALGNEESPEYLDGLLRSLQEKNWAAPMPLIRFKDDPRVRPALFEAARVVPADELGNFAQVVGLVGGEGAEEVLNLRLQELLLDSRTFEDDEFFNWRAGSLASVAEALLRVNPNATQAAIALIKLLEHPCDENRRSIAMNIGEILTSESDTDAIQMLRKAIEPLLTNEDHRSFLDVAPALVSDYPDQVFARCEQLLQDPDYEIGEFAVHTLIELASLSGERANGILLSRLPVEPSLWRAASICQHLGNLAPLELLTSVIREALEHEIPTLRLSGIRLLQHLSPELANEMANQALTDEPDPALQIQLKKYVKPVGDTSA